MTHPTCPDCKQVLIPVTRGARHVEVCVTRTCPNYNKEAKACASDS